VINRGNRRSWVFESDGAKRSFEKTLNETCERSGWILHAWAIMGNHFHLAVETPQPNLSEGMRWLQSVFAVRYNHFRKDTGHIFQGRFKSIVVENQQRMGWLSHYSQMEMVSPDHVGMHAPAVTLRRFTQGAFKRLSSSLPAKMGER